MPFFFLFELRFWTRTWDSPSYTMKSGMGALFLKSFMNSPVPFFDLTSGGIMKFIISLIRRLSSTKLFPIIWTLITLGLLSLPGNTAIPGFGLLGVNHLDKVAHICLFGGFVLFWGLYAWRSQKSASKRLFILVCITMVSILLGVVMEYVQLNYIPYRSFDVWDIWADVAGSSLVFFILIKFGNSLGLTIE